MIFPIPQHESYGVTQTGEVWSQVSGSWKRLALSTNGKWGYFKVKLNNGKTHKVHNLVAKTFLGAKPAGMEVNHKDGIKAHNNVINLEYCTPQQNRKHAMETGLWVPQPKWLTHCGRRLGPKLKRVSKNVSSNRGTLVSGSKLTESAVRVIRDDHSKGRSLSSIAVDHDVSKQTVHRIVKRIKWAHVI